MAIYCARNFFFVYSPNLFYIFFGFRVTSAPSTENIKTIFIYSGLQKLTLPCNSTIDIGREEKLKIIFSLLYCYESEEY